MDTIKKNQPDNVGSPPPAAILGQILFGGLVLQSVCTVAKLGIADMLSEKHQTADELAVKTNTHSASLYRILRALESIGIFALNSDRKFQLTPIGELLRSDVPNSMRNIAIMQGEDWLWSNWGSMMHSIKTGRTAQEKVHGMGAFEFLMKNKEAAEIFNNGMTTISQTAALAIVESYDFSDIRKLVDIGGGHGILLAAILKANSNVQGVLFEQQSVIEGAGNLLEKEGIKNRVDLIKGDFFESIPTGADAYMMKHIIHDWDDKHCVTILKNIHNAIKGNGKVLIVESVIPESSEPHYSKILDLEMLVTAGGKERTEDEYRRLLETSGFRMTRIIPTNSPFSVIEGEFM
jgi:tRNA A58 N-methylase Trm61